MNEYIFNVSLMLLVLCTKSFEPNLQLRGVTFFVQSNAIINSEKPINASNEHIIFL